MKTKIIIYGDDGMSMGIYMDEYSKNRDKSMDPLSKISFNDFLEKKVRDLALKIAKDIDDKISYRMLGTPIDADHLAFYAKLNKSLMTVPIDEILFIKKTKNKTYHVYKTEDYFNEYVALGEKYPHIAKMEFLDLDEKDMLILRGN